MIRVLYIAGCPHWQAALDVAREVAGRAGVPVECVAVTSIEQAHALGFRGSPTVQVNG